MTEPTKPTIKEKQSDTPSNAGLDEFTEYFIKNYPPNTVISNPAWHAPKLYRAATRNLERELAAIRSQPVPVEPVTFDHFTNGDSRDDFGPVVDGRYVLKSDYDSLQSALLKKSDEWMRDLGRPLETALEIELQSVLQRAQYDSDYYKGLMRVAVTRRKKAEGRAEKAEADLKAAEQNVSDLMAEVAQTGALLMKAEATNRRIVELLKEPSANMKSAGYGKPDYLAIFKAMSAELLKEVEK